MRPGAAPRRSTLLAGVVLAGGVLASGRALPETGGPPLSAPLAGYRLGHDSPVDPELQARLEEIDRRLAGELGLAESDRACGLLDLSGPRLALVRPDALFYGASVPKICILLAYFETHPEAADDLPPEVERDLQLMIKHSSNEVAARYSQLVGLETIQRLQLSERYRLYDHEHGGGLWSGKHYGIDAPRRGDPLGDYSHAATVRQCLRFYLMLEQGRLVSPAASRKMRQIFAAPAVEFHDSGFIRGLKGRRVAVIRKNGLWEEWHLDTARVEHGDRVYFLAAMAHHPRGDEYLAALAGEADTLLCGPEPPRPYRHELHRHETPVAFEPGEVIGGKLSCDPPGVLLAIPAAAAGGPAGAAAAAEYLSPPVRAESPFNEVLVSWNVETPPGAAFTVEVRAGRRWDGSWSPFLFAGDWGEVPGGIEKVTECEEGRIDVDFFRSERRFDQVQYRLRAYRARASDGEPGGDALTLRVRRVALCLSDTTGLPDAIARPPVESQRPPAEDWQRRLAVPFRTQRVEDRALGERICSPTSLAMVMAYRGIDRPVLEVAARVYDRAHDIYGNWPRAVQAAFTWGVPGYLTRCARWVEVERAVASGQPLVISIRAQEGELSGAPYPKTSGHLLVLCGFDREGRVIVNDPAASTAAAGQLRYRREELAVVWLRRGGTAYVLLERE